jgi:di/tricarboxylate transporter
VALISSFMQNIGAAALFLPAIQRISKTLGIPLSRLLMPIGFAAILGGTVTLVGSSPLILLNDLIAPFGLEPFGLFDVTPTGLALVASGILCFVLFGRFILPRGTPEAGNAGAGARLSTTPEGEAEAFEIHTPEDFEHYRDPVTVADLRRRYLLTVVGLVEPPDFKVIPPEPDARIRSDVDLLVYGRPQDVTRLVNEEEVVLKESLETFKEDVSETVAGTIEAVVAPRSHLVGKTLAQIDLRERFGVTPLTVYRHGDTFRSEILDLRLAVGDAIQIHGTWRQLRRMRDEGDLLFTTPVDVDLMRPEKALLAGVWLATALTMVMVFKQQLSVSLMTGALGMIITRVISIDEAYGAVDWRTVFLLGGLIPLGIATQKTGTAEWIAVTVLGAIGDVPPIVLLAVVGILSTIFTLVISNVGATVLLVPLVVNLAQQAGADPRMAVLVVGLATSNSFILPTHQVNALYMGPGRYRSKDFMRAGLLVSIVFIVVMLGMISLLYGV